jgi:hypothetical protein
MPVGISARRLVGISACAALFLAAPAGAATIKVTKTGDGGKGSLRAAIKKAGPGDTVKVPKGRYTLKRGVLVIGDPFTVAGAGAKRTIVDANGKSRVFLTTSVDAARITRLTMTGGAADRGGGIQNLGRLVLRRAVVRGNLASEQLGAGSGGGIYTNGDLRLVGTKVVNNLSKGDDTPVIGAGIFATGPDGIDVEVIRSSISRNRAPRGDGGGLFFTPQIATRPANLTVRKSTIAGNVVGAADGSEGGFGAGLSWASSTGQALSSSLVVEDSTLANNVARGNIPFGGGFALSGTLASVSTELHVDMTNVTISGNRVGVPGASGGFGGGMYFSPNGMGTVDMELNHLTVTKNRAVDFGGAGGGGLYDQSTGVAEPLFGNSIIAENISGTGADCLGGVMSHGHNVVGASCGEFTMGGDQIGANPKLGPLEANGGPTLTHALRADSPAIDAADAALCPDKDQRGVNRPQGPDCDIGAYEKRR